MDLSALPPLTEEFIRESNAGTLTAIVAVLFAVPAAIVALRIYVRAFLRGSIGGDDYAMIGALVRRPQLPIFFLAFESNQTS